MEIDGAGDLVGPVAGSLLSCTMGYACGATVAGYNLMELGRCYLSETSQNDYISANLYAKFTNEFCFEIEIV